MGQLSKINTENEDHSILESSLSCDIMPKSIDQDGEAFGALRDTFLYLL